MTWRWALSFGVLSLALLPSISQAQTPIRIATWNIFRTPSLPKAPSLVQGAPVSTEGTANSWDSVIARDNASAARAWPAALRWIASR